ncbi:unannotated protein [freshwater metagenome]|uniref:Unannotated protein n=1 Tax=freshwater metagenome TaxID=449393 RepID=A0A6J6DHS1_9ZZZZ
MTAPFSPNPTFTVRLVRTPSSTSEPLTFAPHSSAYTSSSYCDTSMPSDSNSSVASARASSALGTFAGGCGTHGSTAGAGSVVASAAPLASPPALASAIGSTHSTATGAVFQAGLYHQLCMASVPTVTDGAEPSVGPTVHPPPMSAASSVTSPVTPRAAASACTCSTVGSVPGAKNHEAAGPVRSMLPPAHS